MPTYGQYPLKNWHFNTPYPQSREMSKQQRDWWLDLILKGTFLPPAGPKAIFRQARRADPPLAISGPRVEEPRG
jgi:hypothetical protein